MTNRQPTATESPGIVRRLLVNIGCVVAAIVLLKWLCLEVFVIPSPSMQPTLLGCRESDVRDRVLVDKVSHLISEPSRWDLLVFRSPLQRRQAVVKRCVGLPGERLRFAGGNVYRLEETDAGTTMQVVRKPQAVQRSLWREVYPARRLLRDESKALDGAITATPAAAWREEADGTLVADGGSGVAHSLALGGADGGLVDRIWDGHPAAVARPLREASREWGLLAEIVPDARIEVGLRSDRAIERFAQALTVRRPGKPTLRYALEVDAGIGQLLVFEGTSPDAVGASEPFACAVGPGTTSLAFAHVDDELIAWRNGALLGRLDASRWHCRDGCELPAPRGLERAQPTADHCVIASVDLRADCPVTIANLRICRDLHYTRGILGPDETIVVPPGHYFVLGDNPQQSQDSRGWPAIALARDADGLLVPATSPGATRHRGALELGDPERPPSKRENPVFVRERGVALLVDEFGEPRLFSLDSEVSWHFGAVTIGKGAASWQPRTSTVQFLDRNLVSGRVVARIWPVPPFGPWRLGFVQ